jgi:4-amino-4-deoxy-L-arabinose transferase-like glycosyltransferase
MDVHRSWWRESEVCWLLVLVVAAHFVRAGALPLRGEEPTRAQIAREMVVEKDWVVPREQGEPFGIRPPLQNWAIAASCLALGNWDPWAVRLHSLLAALLTTLMIYGYSRTFLSRLGALTAAVAFATMADIFQMSRQAETEALFILLLSAALLLWHWGMTRRWTAGCTWSIGYGLMALAMLTKGVQAPCYFLGSIVVYLILTRQWRQLFSRAHLLGILVGAAVLLAWIIPYAQVMGWSSVPLVWLGDPAIRVNGGVRDWLLGETAVHLVKYPLEIVAGTLPWSLLLLLFLYHDCRRAIGAAREQVLFLVVCLAVAFPTCWIPPAGQPRYFAPLYPCLAVLVGLAVECAVRSGLPEGARAGWRRFLVTAAWLMVGSAIVVVSLAVLGRYVLPLRRFAEPGPVVLIYALASTAAAFLMLRAGSEEGAAPARRAVLALAGFLTFTFTGIGMDWRLRISEHPAEAMKALLEKLPPGQQLISLNGFNGHTDSLFAYYHGLPIIAPQNDGDRSPYFCIMSPGNDRPQLPFAWEEVGVVSLDRNHHVVPERVVIVGHRLAAPPNP